MTSGLLSLGPQADPATLSMGEMRRMPETPPEWMAAMGLGTPPRRAFAFALGLSALSYATKYPREFFDADGKFKKFNVVPVDGEENVKKLQPHFIIVPLFGALVGYYFF